MPEPARPNALAAPATPSTPTTTDVIGVPLVDLLDRVLATGVMVAGDLVIAIAEVPLVRISLHALLGSVSERIPSPWDIADPYADTHDIYNTDDVHTTHDAPSTHDVHTTHDAPSTHDIKGTHDVDGTDRGDR